VTVELPEHINRLQLPFSWHVAAELCWRVPGHTVYETHSADGLYDSLAVWGPRLSVMINRGGSIHAFVPDWDNDKAPVSQGQALELSLMPDGVGRAVTSVLARFGIEIDGQRPPSTPDVLTYRVIAAALAMHFFRGHWDCRALVPGDEYAHVPSEAPAPDLAAVPANQVWALTRDGEAVAHLASGWAVTADGERMNLLAAYARGSSVEKLAAAVTARPAKRSSDSTLLATSPLQQRAPRWPVGL
jgi:hypothetical protein